MYKVVKEEVGKALKNMGKAKTVGPYNIPTEVEVFRRIEHLMANFPFNVILKDI